jgi:hypothetical protein
MSFPSLAAKRFTFFKLSYNKEYITNRLSKVVKKYW